MEKKGCDGPGSKFVPPVFDRFFYIYSLNLVEKRP